MHIDKSLNDRLLFFAKVDHDVRKSSLNLNKIMQKDLIVSQRISESPSQPIIDKTLVCSVLTKRNQASSKSFYSTKQSTGFENYNQSLSNKTPLVKNEDQASDSCQSSLNKHLKKKSSDMISSERRLSKPKKSTKTNYNGFISFRQHSPYAQKKIKKDKDVFAKVMLYHNHILLKNQAQSFIKEKYKNSYNSDIEKNNSQSKSPKKFTKEHLEQFLKGNTQRIEHSARNHIEQKKIKDENEGQQCTFRPNLSKLNLSNDEHSIKSQVPLINDYVNMRRAKLFCKQKDSHNISQEFKVSKRKYILNNNSFVFN